MYLFAKTRLNPLSIWEQPQIRATVRPSHQQIQLRLQQQVIAL